MTRKPGFKLPRMRMVTCAFLFSSGGVAIKLTSLTSWQVAGFRAGIAALALLLLLPSARRHVTGRAWLIGCAYAAMVVLFVTANKLTTAASTIFLQATSPLYVSLLATVLLRERQGREDRFAMAVMAIGLVVSFLSVDAPATMSPQPLLGNILATLSGLAWALTIIGLRWITTGEKHYAALPTIVAGNIVAFVICLPFAIPTNPKAIDLAILVYLGVVQVAVGHALFVSAIPFVPAFDAALILLIEPALNPLWVWLTLDERPGFGAIAGGILILAATASKVLQTRS